MKQLPLGIRRENHVWTGLYAGDTTGPDKWEVMLVAYGPSLREARWSAYIRCACAGGEREFHAGPVGSRSLIETWADAQGCAPDGAGRTTMRPVGDDWTDQGVPPAEFVDGYDLQSGQLSRWHQRVMEAT